ncbi:ATP-dependent DNA helicase Q-like SIM [Cucurbita pepo subsp. pepo]|uniref:ATP-dependent DNA helicase Q-like SIM n=1 Tax=Cucurbita pepo subsp. pepo TaxID=3664 RepID=UPI000C9D394A|nr:ATP-dependent DNA helicase Q-like SIM [Cucurbita pepo subsp. pepo]XP_023537888.1 ATP-dependent DNA helicase Q-like SIM [Cucurbita pepo subsp. pepo]XP_023537889.1 ATP-dependent DNA helicase Q-like SIM [Cucurbita pepo subsp. pepo]XP_023537890.1 ATP-dependent DNA helicase Q-like SIM [Cucurbita pepo subsp. pepo]
MLQRSGKRAQSLLVPMRQSSILDHFSLTNRGKRSKTEAEPVLPIFEPEVSHYPVEDTQEHRICDLQAESDSYLVDWSQEPDTLLDWEKKLNRLLKKHFGYPFLKKFQKEALEAWLNNQDCLVLAATGSGKSICFQLPALLTGKVVVVISPLISLMHDQCLKLAKHGVSACFLGSGQPDSSVEKKAMGGAYSIIYVCPETVLRLIQPLQKLAETRGIALFAIDEVHCVSKWGHDFRPDYRRLSILRENFSSSTLKFLRFDVPLMALTATATVQVREDILKSLCMSKETKIILTSFFRPNLRFSVKHSKTTSPSSYRKDFSDLIDMYAGNRRSGNKKQTIISHKLDSVLHCSTDNILREADRKSPDDVEESDDSDSDRDDIDSEEECLQTSSSGRTMSVEYLENEVDVFQSVDDWDVACGEFCGQLLCEDRDVDASLEEIDVLDKAEERLKSCRETLEQGPTIVYVPTRKETLSVSKFLCQSGVKAAAYNASLPKSHLRTVHKDFHDNNVEVVVATIAFGMGIDKSNVRRIIHYGWPQSLEAYYQEAGRAGRDGKLADCILFANLTRIPSLLPNRRSEEQTNQAYRMLSDCFRYGMNTTNCRAQKLVEYFGESFDHKKCFMCDVCVKGPPNMQNLKEEANILMQVIAAHHQYLLEGLYDDFTYGDVKQRFREKPSLRLFVSKVREQSMKFAATDMLWWRGLTRILEAKGYLKEGDNRNHVQIKFPEPTKLGLEFLSRNDQIFNVCPEADMLLSMAKPKSFSSFSEWGRGWADPAIRRERLKRRRHFVDGSREPRPRKGRKRKSRKHNSDTKTVRGRLTAKLSVKK